VIQRPFQLQHICIVAALPTTSTNKASLLQPSSASTMASSLVPLSSGRWRFAQLIYFLLLVTGGTHPSSAAHPARKLLQRSPAASPAAAASAQTPAAQVASPNPSDAPSPAPGVSGPVPLLGGSPPLYQPPGILTDPACATDDTVEQLAFTLIGDVLGLIPEVRPLICRLLCNSMCIKVGTRLQTDNQVRICE
jgi:hypothetical protein